MFHTKRGMHEVKSAERIVYTIRTFICGGDHHRYNDNDCVGGGGHDDDDDGSYFLLCLMEKVAASVYIMTKNKGLAFIFLSMATFMTIKCAYDSRIKKYTKCSRLKTE
jgi:hypothetical protein